MQKSITIIIPVFNEVDSLKELQAQLENILENRYSYEILYMNDGSFDGSEKILDELSNQNASTKAVHFHRNYGKAAALAEGFKLATGDYVMTMDADLQDDPAEIPNFITKLEEGFDLVSGWKKDRKDPLGKTMPSRFFNFVTRLMTGVKIHDFNCGIKMYKNAVNNAKKAVSKFVRNNRTKTPKNMRRKPNQKTVSSLRIPAGKGLFRVRIINLSVSRSI